MFIFNPATQSYIDRLLHSVPIDFYIAALALFLMCLFFFASTNAKRAVRLSLMVLFSEYVCLLLCSTVFYRNEVKLVGYNYKPFRSYVDYFCGNADYLLPQVIMNVIVFIPIGLLLSMLFQFQKWWLILIIGGSVSITIEMLQLFFQRGFCEVDDVIHNLLGCIVGIVLFRGIKKMIKGFLCAGMEIIKG